MIVKSVNGFLKYFPQEPEELLRFKKTFGFDLIREYDYFTFENLIGLPRHSIAGVIYGGTLATKTYEGRHPSDVLKVNELVYDMELETLVPMLTLLGSVTLRETQGYATNPTPFLQPGVFVDDAGSRLLSYSGWLSMDFKKIYIFDRELV